MGDSGANFVDLALDRAVVERIDRRVQRIDQEQPDHRMRRHQVDLEFRAGGDLAGIFEPLEIRVGFFGDVGIEQIVEAHVLGAKSQLERVALAAGAAGVHAEELAGFLQRRIVRKHRLEPGDPVAARAGLAVRQPLDARAESGADGFKHFRRIRHRHAADEINVARHDDSSLPRDRHCGSTLSSLPNARHCSCSLRMAAALLSGVPPPAVASPKASSRSRISGPLRYRPISRLSRATMSVGVPAGATMAKKPFITTPGTVSRSVGRSGKPGKRVSEVTASRRTLPAWTTCAADRYGTSIRSRPARLLNSFAPNAAAPAVLSKAMDSLPGLALA